MWLNDEEHCERVTFLTDQSRIDGVLTFLFREKLRSEKEKKSKRKKKRKTKIKYLQPRNVYYYLY